MWHRLAMAVLAAAVLVAVAVAAAVAAPGEHTYWYISRAAGLSAYLLLFANVCLGLLVRTRFLALVAPWQAFDLHQFTALLSLGFLALHALALLGDRYVGFDLADLLVPLAAAYRPAWTALGVLAADLVAGVTVSSYVRARIGQRTWRAIHYLAFVAYAMALFHGIYAGSDSAQPWARALYLATGFTVGGLTVWRILEPGGRRSQSAARPPAAGRRAAESSATQ